MLPVLLFVPFGLGAKGCDAAVVGDDCPPGTTNPRCATESSVCGGLRGTPCGDGEYCNYPIDARCGRADQTGECAPIPEACELSYAPVCGCDGKTYGNACEAARAGVSVESKGACEGSPDDRKVCGGLRGLACGPGEYCNYPIEARCGAADQTGFCTPLAELCTTEYDPVCGCDGKTYSNDCVAARAGVSIAAMGPCDEPPSEGKACGGLLGLTCGPGEYCNYPIEARCGAADQTGVCTRLAEICDTVLDPVCGCDGKTYSNDCVAAQSGVSVAAKGPCGEPPSERKPCGGLLGLTCERGEFCNYPIEAQCGAADQTGFCTPLAQACTTEYDPVCGCDGKTYGNACVAAQSGVSVASKGACDEEPPGSGRPCGRQFSSICPRGEFCFYGIDQGCGEANEIGVCRPIPQGCTKEFQPVCGCDGNTYGNACTAFAAGVSVRAEDSCETTICGGPEGLECPKGQYCNYPVECGAGDRTGTCRPIPDACTTEYVPVCGCDGKTYGNRCAAASAGISVSSAGPCE